MRAIRFFLFLFYLSSWGCYGWTSSLDSIQSRQGPSGALAPTSQSRDHWQIMLDKLHQRRLEYGEKWQGVPWDKQGVRVNELRSLFVVLVALAPEDRKIFQQVRSELCWWILLARSSEVWKDKTEYDELDEVAQHALQQLYDRVPLVFDIRGQSWWERVLRHWLNPFHWFGYGQKIIVAKNFFWWLSPRNWFNVVWTAWENMQIRRTLLVDDMLEKSLWFLIDPAEVAMVEVDFEKNEYGRFKHIFYLRIWDKTWKRYDFLLKISRSMASLEEGFSKKAEQFIQTEPYASMLFSDIASGQFPVVGVWGSILDVHIETSIGEKSLIDLMREIWSYQLAPKKITEMQKIVDGVVNIFLAINAKVYPLYAGFGDENMNNVRVLQYATELKFGKIDFGNTQLYSEPGMKIYELIRDVSEVYYRVTYLTEGNRLTFSEWLAAFIQAFYVRGELDYIKAYVRYLKQVIIHNHPDDENHDIDVTALHDLSSILYEIVLKDLERAQAGFPLEGPSGVSQMQKLDYLNQSLLFLERLIWESPGGTDSERLRSVRAMKANVRILREHGKLPDRFPVLVQAA